MAARVPRPPELDSETVSEGVDAADAGPGSPLVSPVQSDHQRLECPKQKITAHMGHPIPDSITSVSPTTVAIIAVTVTTEQDTQSKAKAEPEERRQIFSKLQIFTALLIGIYCAGRLGRTSPSPTVSGTTGTTCTTSTHDLYREAGRGPAAAGNFVTLVLNPGMTDVERRRYVECLVKRDASCLEDPPLPVLLQCSDQPGRDSGAPVFRAYPVLLGVMLLCFASLAALVLRRLPRATEELEALAEQSGSLPLTSADCRPFGQPSWIHQLNAVQNSVSRLTRGMDNFERFLPPTIAQNIAAGDACSSRPHVRSREVTIMFSSIRDFTTLSETLPPGKMLTIINRYLSVMISIVEMYEGTVSEVQDGGLLTFWNTPTSVDDHIAKAAKAALARQEAMVMLNSEFAELGLPELTMRIGLHSGPVLSGILGSESRMKFGCLGDSMNLASRLEGLSEHYGVGIICSAPIRQALAHDSSVLFRRLDTVKVKGRQEPTVIYELMSRDPHSADLGLTADPAMQAHEYEQALDAYQAGHFGRAQQLARQALQARPNDLAATRLLGRVAGCLDESGHVCLGQAELARWTGIMVMDKK